MSVKRKVTVPVGRSGTLLVSRARRQRSTARLDGRAADQSEHGSEAVSRVRRLDPVAASNGSARGETSTAPSLATARSARGLTRSANRGRASPVHHGHSLWRYFAELRGIARSAGTAWLSKTREWTASAKNPAYRPATETPGKCRGFYFGRQHGYVTQPEVSGRGSETMRR